MKIRRLARIRSSKTIAPVGGTEVVRSACNAAATGSACVAIDWAEITILTAFIGAVFGAIGALTGALVDDPVLCAVAAGGGGGCAAVWAHYLQLGDRVKM